jgi:hypothetical protein
MARKRGGIAGFYDRNKGVIKTVAPIAAGFIPGVGPLVGAALGAAMGGDTEGKGYFSGFDAGGAVKGGLSGYGGAKLGQAAKGGLAKMFTASPLDKLTGAPQVGLTAGGPSSYGAMGSFQPTMAGGAGAAAGAAPTAAYTGNVGGYGIGMPLGSAAPVPSSAMADLPAMDMAKMRRLTQTTGAPLPNIPAPQMGAMPRLASQVADKPMGRFAQAGKFAKENKDLIALAGQGIQSVLPNAAANATADAAYMNAETNRMRLEQEQSQEKMEEERRRRIAELLMPMFTQIQQSRPSYGG